MLFQLNVARKESKILKLSKTKKPMNFRIFSYLFIGSALTHHSQWHIIGYVCSTETLLSLYENRKIVPLSILSIWYNCSRTNKYNKVFIVNA